MTIYKLYAASTASTDGLVYFDFPVDGKLAQIIFALRATTASATAASGQIELAFASASSFTTNDVRSSIVIIPWHVTAVSGLVNHGSMFAQVDVGGVTYSAGERLYVHSSVILSPAVLTMQIYAYGDDKASTLRRVRS